MRSFDFHPREQGALAAVLPGFVDTVTKLPQAVGRACILEGTYRAVNAAPLLVEWCCDQSQVRGSETAKAIRNVLLKGPFATEWSVFGWKLSEEQRVESWQSIAGGSVDAVEIHQKAVTLVLIT